MKYIVTINNNSYEVEVDHGHATLTSTQEVAMGTVKPVGNIAAASSVTISEQTTQVNTSGEPLKSPMPGTILDIKVSQGTHVKKGDVLFILEAMKMENELNAPKDGIVTQISVTKGMIVATNDVLAVIQ
jgi:biotin carboxyl carrier protein